MCEGSFRLRKCALHGVEAVEASSGHVFGRHTHDAFAVGRIIEGGQRSWSGCGTVEARKGDMISSNAGEVHDGTPLGQSRTWKMLYTSPQLVGELVLDLQEGRTSEFEFTQPVFGRSPAVRKFEQCYAVMTRPPFDLLAAETALILLFESLLVRSRPQSAPPTSELVRARDRIDSDPLSPLSLQDLARESRLSRYQALRGFTRLTGLPPHAYQVQRRLEIARRMIASGVSLSDAAAASGFADQSHMHRNFVRRFGFTPGDYAAAAR